MQQSEPHNPCYLLLLLVSLLFVITVLAIVLVPILEKQALEAGEVPPPSPVRASLHDDGLYWLGYELAAMFVLGLLSMGLDRLRRLQKDRAQATIPPADQSSSSV